MAVTFDQLRAISNLARASDEQLAYLTWLLASMTGDWSPAQGRAFVEQWNTVMAEKEWMHLTRAPSHAEWVYRIGWKSPWLISLAQPIKVFQGAREPRIVTSFEKRRFGAEGEFEEERGWVDVAGYDFDVEVDADEPSLAERAATWLRDEGGALEASGSAFSPGVWYTQADGNLDYRTGWTTQLSFHLLDFTPDEEAAIFRALTRRR